MKIIDVDISGLKLIEPDVYNDPRGFFYESFNLTKYSFITNEFTFVQDNVSKSKYGTIRGLHYQVGKFAQGKLVSVLGGKVLDVAVDLRFGSPTFGKYFSVELSSKNKKQLWIPPGFAHGFSVLSEEVIFTYKCTAFYNRESERSIIYDDSELNIDWKIENPIVSEKDKLGKHFKDISKDFLF